MKTLILSAIVGLMTSQAFAKDIFVMTKSIRQKNVIHFDANVQNCTLTDKTITAFWILGEKQGQRQELTPSEIPKFAPQIVSNDGKQLEFTLGAFSEVQDSVTDQPILVKLDSNCEAKAYVTVNGEKILLNEVHAKISILKMGVKYLLLKGKKSNGSNFTYQIDA